MISTLLFASTVENISSTKWQSSHYSTILSYKSYFMYFDLDLNLIHQFNFFSCLCKSSGSVSSFLRGKNILASTFASTSGQQYNIERGIYPVMIFRPNKTHYIKDTHSVHYKFLLICLIAYLITKINRFANYFRPDTYCLRVIRKQSTRESNLRQNYPFTCIALSVSIESSSNSHFHASECTSGGRLNKKDGLTGYGDPHVKDKTS